MATALAEFDAALGVDPRHVDALISRGGAYQLNGDVERAMADYDEALRIDPDNSVALSNRGALYLSTSRFGPAIVGLGRAIELDASYGQAYLNRAVTRVFQRPFLTTGGTSCRAAISCASRCPGSTSISDRSAESDDSAVQQRRDLGRREADPLRKHAVRMFAEAAILGEETP